MHMQKLCARDGCIGSVRDHVPTPLRTLRACALRASTPEGVIPPGSCLVISHIASDIHPRNVAEMIKRMNSHLAEGDLVGRPRRRDHIVLDGLDLMEPGVVTVNQ